MDDILYWLWMTEVLGYAGRHTGAALAWAGDARGFYTALREGRRAPFLTRAMRERAQSREPGDLRHVPDDCARAGTAILTPDDPDYPARLRGLPDLPLVLYATGSTACLNGGRYAAMVGTRRPTPYGKRACDTISRELARQGVVIVSGMADGLDSVAQTAAVETGTPTVAFLGTPIDKTYPAANAGLRAGIERLGGAVLSEYPPGFTGRMQGTFLARNRLIAALGEVLCVTEASARSGTMNTVGHAERYGRPIFAVPGSIFSQASAGTNELLRTGRARAACSAGDLCGALGLASGPDLWQNDPGEDAVLDLTPEARKVLAVLGPDPQSFEEICRAAALPAAQVLAAYTELELAGAAIPGPGRTLAAAH